MMSKNQRGTIDNYYLCSHEKSITSNEDWLDGMLDIQKEASDQMRLEINF
jgi:hypothetical protein